MSSLFGCIHVFLPSLNLVMSHSCIMKCFLQAHLFPSLPLQTLLIIFSPVSLLFLFCLYFWTSLLFYFFYQCSHSHQMFVILDVCCLSSCRNLMWKEKGSKSAHCLEVISAKVQGALVPEENPHLLSLRRNPRTSWEWKHFPHTFLFCLHSSQTRCTWMWLHEKSKQEPFKLGWTIQFSKALHVHLSYSSHAFQFFMS